MLRVVICLFLAVFCYGWSEEQMIAQLGVQEFDGPLACENTCQIPITWTSPLGACGLDGNQYYNILANSTFSSYFQCLIKNLGKPNPNIGINYPGSCGCPNFCHNITNSGTCVSSQCSCANGWDGPDCSQVTLQNQCNGVGSVQNVSGFLTCVCNEGYSLNDCSAAVAPLPPIVQVIEPVHQYTDKDDYRNKNPIFNDSVISQIHLTMPPEFLTYQLQPENRQSDQYFPVDMWFYNGHTIQTMDKVGFRLKGFSTRNYVKKNWKLSFNKFESGRKWAQQKKVNLKSMQQDVSAIKEVLCLALLYSMNAPAQRYAYTQLFINEQSMGSYIILENIDDQFLDSRFGNDEGALYKCIGDLAYLGPDPEAYRNATGFGSTAYSPETDAAEDFSLLRDFITVLNVTSDSEFVNLLPNIFDVDLFVRILAVEVMTGNADGIWNGNNYFLYYNPELEKFQYFRQDLEIALGTWNGFYHMATKPIYTWGDGGRGYRLINRVLANEPFRGMFTSYCKQLIDVYFQMEGEFMDRLLFLNQELAPLIYKDQWRFTDMGYGYEQFVNLPHEGITIETGSNWKDAGFPFMHTFGLTEFMNLRIQTALAQLE